MRVRARLSTTLFVCTLLCAAIHAPAQEPTGTITGTITDASGAVVPNANITVTNRGTGAIRTTVATSAGLYSAPSLLPGTYQIRVEQQGFRTAVSEVQVLAGGTSTVNLSITPGAP